MQQRLAELINSRPFPHSRARVRSLILQPSYPAAANVHRTNLTLLVLPSLPKVLKKQSKSDICPFQQRPVDEPLDALFTGCRAAFFKDAEEEDELLCMSMANSSNQSSYSKLVLELFFLFLYLKCFPKVVNVHLITTSTQWQCKAV